MKKFILMFLIVGISYEGIAQETQLFISKKLSVFKKNTITKEYDFAYSKEGYTPIIYGKDYLQLGKDPRLKFTLYGEVTKDEDEYATYFRINGFTKEGFKMNTQTVYGKKLKYIKVFVTLIDNMYIYDIQLSDER
jgi:hypothetical protein